MTSEGIMKIKAMRIGKDDSLSLVVQDEPRIHLSPQQLFVLLSALDDARGFVPIEELYPVVFKTQGPATASQRASMSRLSRRLQDRGLTTGKENRIVRLSEDGRAVAKFARAQGWPDDERW